MAARPARVNTFVSQGLQFSGQGFFQPLGTGRKNAEDFCQVTPSCVFCNTPAGTRTRRCGTGLPVYVALPGLLYALLLLAMTFLYGFLPCACTRGLWAVFSFVGIAWLDVCKLKRFCRFGMGHGRLSEGAYHHKCCDKQQKDDRDFVEPAIEAVAARIGVCLKRS